MNSNAKRSQASRIYIDPETDESIRREAHEVALGELVERHRLEYDIIYTSVASAIRRKMEEETKKKE